MDHPELHTENTHSRLGWLRAAVLGADDGIVSVGALVVGVAGASDSLRTLLLTGIAGLLAGALSMAAGEYVSVSSQRDSEKALLAKEKRELKEYPKEEFEELTHLYEKRGLTRATAEQVAKELTAHDVFLAHAEAELGIDPRNLTNPLQAAVASAAAFTVGAVIPIIFILLPSASMRVPVTFLGVLLALAGTGLVSARISSAPAMRVTMRIVVGGMLAMIVTFAIGKMFGGVSI